MKILKYELGNTMLLPKEADILSFQMQRGVLCLWALVHPDAPLVEHKFRCFYTGEEVTPDTKDTRLDYKATVQDGSLVWHIFKERMAPK